MSFFGASGLEALERLERDLMAVFRGKHQRDVQLQRLCRSQI